MILENCLTGEKVNTWNQENFMLEIKKLTKHLNLKYIWDYFVKMFLTTSVWRGKIISPQSVLGEKFPIYYSESIVTYLAGWCKIETKNCYVLFSLQHMNVLHLHLILGVIFYLLCSSWLVLANIWSLKIIQL